MPTPAALQPEYERYSASFAGRAFRVGSALALVLVPMGSLFDLFIFPDQYKELLVIRLACAGLIGALWWVFTLTGPNEHHGAFFTLLLGIIISASIVMMVMITGGYRSSYYAGLNLVILCFGLLAPWRTADVVVACVAIYALYLGPILITQEVTELGWFMNNNYFLLFTMAIAIVSGHVSARSRRREFTLRHSLKQANRNKDVFVSNISHELRTPLALILGPLESMLQGELGRFDADERNSIERMHDNAVSLLQQINDLLDLTRLEEGRMVLRVGAGSIGALVEGLMGRVEPAAETKAVKLSLTSSGDLSGLYFDRAKIEKVAINLLSNALKFTPRGGEIVVALRGEDESVVLEVGDTGIGIPADQLDVIFDRFAQADAGSKREYGGSGIGLSLVKEIVALHGGEVSVESTLGRGSTFRVRLPKGTTHLDPSKIVQEENERSEELLEVRRLVKTANVQADPIADAAQVTASLVQEGQNERDRGPDRPVERILIVEDNPDVYRLVGRTLHKAYRVEIAPNGVEGLRAVRRSKPDLVITDVMMPKMDGIAMLAQIRAEETSSRIPVIVLSSKAELSSKIAGLEQGADDYIPKPFNPRELRARVEAQLVRKRFEQELAKTRAQLAHHDRLTSVGVLAAGVAHEIKNPMGRLLRGIGVTRRHLRALQQGAAPEPSNATTDGELLTVLDDNEQDVKLVVGIVDSLLEFSRKDHQGMDSVDLNETIETVLRLVGPQIAGNLDVSTDLRSIGTVFCLPAAISQVFANIILNAHQAVEGRGRLWIGTERRDEWVVIRFRNDGPPIPEDVLGRVFDPFFTTKPVGSGTGLGLSICHAIVQQHRGAIDVANLPAGGVELRVSLPAEPMEANQRYGARQPDRV